jgi:hypothetical protein
MVNLTERVLMAELGMCEGGKPPVAIRFVGLTRGNLLDGLRKSFRWLFNHWQSMAKLSYQDLDDRVIEVALLLIIEQLDSVLGQRHGGKKGLARLNAFKRGSKRLLFPTQSISVLYTMRY